MSDPTECLRTPTPDCRLRRPTSGWLEPAAVRKPSEDRNSHRRVRPKRRPDFGSGPGHETVGNASRPERPEHPMSTSTGNRSRSGRPPRSPRKRTALGNRRGPEGWPAFGWPGSDPRARLGSRATARPWIRPRRAPGSNAPLSESRSQCWNTPNPVSSP